METKGRPSGKATEHQPVVQSDEWTVALVRKSAPAGVAPVRSRRRQTAAAGGEIPEFLNGLLDLKASRILPRFRAAVEAARHQSLRNFHIPVIPASLKSVQISSAGDLNPAGGKSCSPARPKSSFRSEALSDAYRVAMVPDVALKIGFDEPEARYRADFAVPKSAPGMPLCRAG